jgi:integrase
MPNKKLTKPKKPYPSFPLTPTPRGWVKKIHGRLHWFGPAHDPEEALRRYLARASALHAGEKIAIDPERMTVRDLAQRYLDARKLDAEAGSLSLGWYAKSFKAVDLFVKTVGEGAFVADLTAEHFAAYQRAVKGKGENGCVRAVRAWINYADDKEWCRPVRMGRAFRPGVPASSEELVFTPEECRGLIRATQKTSMMRALVLLGLNGGMGQKDLAAVTVDRVDFAGWIRFPRPKTIRYQIPRRFPLWPETLEAVKWHLGGKTNDAPVFRTERGHLLVREKVSKNKNVSVIDRVAPLFDELMEAAEVAKSGRNFYSLRRTFRTIADEQGDNRAIDLVMGHAPSDMGGVYVRKISDDRLRAVCNHVRSVVLKKSKGRPARQRPTDGDPVRRPAPPA